MQNLTIVFVDTSHYIWAMNFENVDRLIGDYAGKSGGTEVQVAVGKSGALIYEHAPSTLIFDLDTMTQSLATSLVFIGLVAKEKINLNALVTKYWPDFGEEGKEKVTLRHLIKHTAGLPANRPYFKELMDEHPDWLGSLHGRDFILNHVASEALEYPPTYTLVPSNLGYLALGHLAELISGRPINTLFEEYVSAPLALADTSFGVPENKKGRSAKGFYCPYRNRELVGEVLEPNAWAMGGVAGHAGLFGTVSDAVKIGVALCAATKADGGIFPTAIVNDFVGSKAKYKMGWEVPDRTSPICGTKFSWSTIGHITKTGMSLWIDLDDGVTVAAFTALRGTQNKENLNQLVAFLPALHDAIRETVTT